MKRDIETEIGLSLPGIYASFLQIFMEIGSVVFCVIEPRTDRQTNKQIDTTLSL